MQYLLYILLLDQSCAASALAWKPLRKDHDAEAAVATTIAKETLAYVGMLHARFDDVGHSTCYLQASVRIKSAGYPISSRHSTGSQ